MTMTEYEICKEFREAAKPQEQIAILADLNVCSKKEIAEILIKNGEKNIPKYYLKTKDAGAKPADREKGKDEAKAGAAEGSKECRLLPVEEYEKAAGIGEKKAPRDAEQATGKTLLALLNSLWDLERLSDMPVLADGQLVTRASITGVWSGGAVQWFLDLGTK